MTRGRWRAWPGLAVWLALVIAAWSPGMADADAGDAGVSNAGVIDAGPDIGPEHGALLQPQADVRAQAYVDVERVLLGQTFNLLIVVHDEAGREILAELPSSLFLGPAFEPGRRHQERRTRVDGTPYVEFQVEVTPWRVGSQTIPPIPVVIPERGA